ncbi:2-oxoadipate dioxygenase/decarboxylase family protein, partial [Burkholderia sp. SIMBA_052]|uniref:2-oxoadipate dioxygenase/decarboxylase family protein n=1 Tax=Burkholderia sp. SIMBA_052 TaxID=3085793 RepID=UPI00397E7CB1
VHSTAFRPVGDEALKRNPFRVFTSLLRLDLIADQELRKDAARILETRRIFTAGAVELTEEAEKDGGLSKDDADRFVAEVLETFRWHDKA